MPTLKKVQEVEALEERLNRCTIAIATNFQGLSVEAMTELRRRLRAKGVEYKVVKNTLTYLAAEKAGRSQFREIVQGPTGLALGYEDPLEPARVLEEFIRTTRLPLSIRGAMMDGHILTTREVLALATLPTRPEMAARLVGALQSRLSGLVYVLRQPLTPLFSVVFYQRGPLLSFPKNIEGA